MAGAAFVLLAVLGALLVLGWPRLVVERAWRRVALLLIAALCVVHQLMFGTLAEDAFITFRYATNLADGHGLVFNIGEYVEGYSSFLLVVLLAAARGWFGMDVESTAYGIGVLCTVGCVFAAHVLARRLSGRPEIGVLAAALTAAAGTLAAYGPSGLETSLFAVLLLGVLLAVHGERWVVAGLLVALATMTRPEGLLAAVLIAGWLVIRALRASLSWWKPTAFVLGGSVIGVPWMAWRLTYYGHLLSNVVAAKSGGSAGWRLRSGWDYLVGYALAFPVLLALLAVAAIALFVRWREFSAQLRAQLGLLAGLCVLLLGFAVLVGGDWMPAWRLLAPLAPLFAVFAAVGLGSVSTVDARVWRSRVVPGVVAAVCVLSVAGSVLHQAMLPSVRAWRAQVVALGEIGRWLGNNLPHGTVISTFANGALSYRVGTGVTVVDQLGLTDEHIARQGERHASGIPGHLAHDDQYIVDVRRPAVMVPSGSGYARQQTCEVPEAFWAGYVPATFQVRGGRGWVSLYLRADEAPELITSLNRDARFRHKSCTAAGP